MAVLSPFGPFRAFDSNGDPLSGGKLYTYEAGTSTPKDTYTDSGGLTANSNPVILDSAGYANVWLGGGGYKFILKTSADATLWTIDDIGGDSENAFGSSITVSTGNLSVTSIYANGVIRQTGAGTLSLLSAATAGAGFYFIVRLDTSATVTVDPNSTELINGAATLNLTSDAVVICDGTNWYTLFMADVSEARNNSFTGTNSFSGSTSFTGRVLTPSDGTLTIASGVITVTGVYHLIDTEGAAAIDQLDTINGFANGYSLTLRTNDDGRDVVITNAGNIVTPDGNNVFISASGGTISLRYDGGKSKWLVQAQALPSLIIPALANKVLSGLTLSNNVADATNDIDIAAGSCVSDDGTMVMTLSSAYTKQLDAGWTVGSGVGGLDTGAIANTTYHVWVIGRVDTNVIDVLFSASATAPTMPANYTKKKCIGSIIRVSASILAFTQTINRFRLSTPFVEHDITNPGTSAVTRTLTQVPTGVALLADLTVGVFPGTTNPSAYLSALSSADVAPQAAGTAALTAPGQAASGAQWDFFPVMVLTNTSAQIRSRMSSSGAADHLGITTYGWIDTRI